jgi:cell division protein FtsL
MMKNTLAAWMVLIVELSLVLLTSFGLIVNTYRSRQEFASLEQLRSEQRDLEDRWAKLLLEESAFSSPSRVERIARSQLNMYLPGLDDIKELKNLNGTQ